MLRRRITRKLDAWSNSPKRKALVLLGARQTGKTYSIREFGRSRYKEFLEVNFLDDGESARFLSTSGSAEELVSRLSLIAGHTVVPGTLLFFDEIQGAAREVVTLAKFLVEDGRFDVVLSGSLLGAELGGVSSFPVGYAQVERMFPLDFEEFCWALGVPEAVLGEVRHAYAQKTPLEESLHERLTALYRQYIVVGGMPEAVSRFVDGRRDLGGARAVCLDLVEQYRFDIAKYANDRKLNMHGIYDNIPAQLSKENKRFMMQAVRRGATHERLCDDFAWLVDAGVALPAYLASEPKRPLLRTKVNEKFKLYASDCGMLLSRYPAACAMEIIEGAGDGNYGAVYENVVAQELAAAGFPLYYYHHSRKGELDFLAETAGGEVLPIEVKSGKDYKLHAALNNLLGTDGFHIESAVVLSEHNVSIGEREGKPVYYLPLYMTLCLRDELVDPLGGMQAEQIDFADWE